MNRLLECVIVGKKNLTSFFIELLYMVLIEVQSQPFIWITLGRHKSDDINRLITLPCSLVYCLDTVGQAMITISSFYLWSNVVAGTGIFYCYVKWLNFFPFLVLSQITFLLVSVCICVFLCVSVCVCVWVLTRYNLFLYYLLENSKCSYQNVLNQFYVSNQTNKKNILKLLWTPAENYPINLKRKKWALVLICTIRTNNGDNCT